MKRIRSVDGLVTPVPPEQPVPLQAMTSWWLGHESFQAFTEAAQAEAKRLRNAILPTPVQRILDETLDLEARELMGKDTRRTRARLSRHRGVI
jgi:hypothetical protein